MNQNTAKDSHFFSGFVRAIFADTGDGLTVKTNYAGIKESVSRAEFSMFECCTRKFKYKKLPRMGFTLTMRIFGGRTSPDNMEV